MRGGPDPEDDKINKNQQRYRGLLLVNSPRPQNVLIRPCMHRYDTLYITCKVVFPMHMIRTFCLITATSLFNHMFSVSVRPLFVPKSLSTAVLVVLLLDVRRKDHQYRTAQRFWSKIRPPPSSN